MYKSLIFFSLLTAASLHSHATTLNCDALFQTASESLKVGYVQTLTNPRDSRNLHLYTLAPTDMSRVDLSTVFVADPTPTQNHIRTSPLRGPVIVSYSQRPMPQGKGGSDPLGPPLNAGEMTEVPAGPWASAVFENRFATLKPSNAAQPNPNYVLANGVAEVVIFDQDINVKIAQLPVNRIELIFSIVVDRFSKLARLPQIKHLSFFENSGKEAAASQPHAHGQIYALPLIPPETQSQVKIQEDLYDQLGRTYIGFEAANEIHLKKRVLYVSKSIVAYVPEAPQMPFEVWIVPRREVAHITEMTKEELRDLSRALKLVLMKYNLVLDGEQMSYSMLLNQAPIDRAYPKYHMRIELRPVKSAPGRIKMEGGIEKLTRVFVTTNPEAMAETLNAAKVRVQYPIWNP